MILPARVLELHERRWSQVLDLLNDDPITNCFLYSRLQPLLDLVDFTDQPLRPGKSIKTLTGGEIWLHESAGEIDALCYAGANLVPTHASDAALDSFAQRALRVGRYSSSLVGPKASVLGLWGRLEAGWGPARAVRRHQPLLAIDSAPLVAADPLVRCVEPVELPLLWPASIAMFTEELGISPLGNDAGAMYRAKLAELIAGRHAFARFENGETLFKCEIGAISPKACQIQGVWTKPDRRGEGIGTAGLATVVQIALTLAPTVCLYVNDFNVAARRSYDKIGFREVGAFASVLF